MNNVRPRIDYLVGGLRISLSADSATPGPRTHIVGFTDAARRNGFDVVMTLASDWPPLDRFKRVSQEGYKGSSAPKRAIVDLVRLAAGLWSGVQMFRASRSQPPPEFIYERVAVFQSLASFHRHRRSVVTVVEANGILARESARDRKIVFFARVASAIERRVLRRADMIVAVSESLKIELIKYAGVRSDKIKVVPNGVRPDVFDLPDRRDAGDFVVGFVGSVVEWQNLDMLVAAAAHLRKDGHRVRVGIVGDGPDLSRVLEAASRAGVGDFVEGFGRVSQDEAFALLSTFHCGYAGHLASSSATMYHSPLKLYEYAGAGLDVVCSPSADAASLREAGVRVEMFGTVGELTDAIRGYIEGPTVTAQERDVIRSRVREVHSWDARFLEVVNAVRAFPHVGAC